MHKRRSSVNFGARHFSRKCMYEKLVKCAAKIMLCILKIFLKTGFEIQNYISRIVDL